MQKIKIDPDYFQQSKCFFEEISLDMNLYIRNNEVNNIELFSELEWIKGNRLKMQIGRVLFDLPDDNELIVKIIKKNECLVLLINETDFVYLCKNQNDIFKLPHDVERCLIMEMDESFVFPGLPRLQVLCVNDCSKLEELPNLENNKQLRVLKYFNLNLVSDISSIGSVSDLKELRLLDCEKITNIDSLTSLGNLTSLTVNNCKKLGNIDGLKNLIKLTEVDLSGCESLENVDGLKNLTRLTELDLNYCTSLANVNSLAKLKHLTKLSINLTINFTQLNQGNFDNTKFLSSLVKLKTLSLTFQENIKNIDGFSQLTELTSLDMSYCKSLENVDGLKNLTKLKELNLSWCESLENVDGLKNLTNLTELNLSYCRSLENVDELMNLTKLTELDLGNCESLENVDGLKNLTELTELNLSRCESLKNIEGLKNLTRLTNLDLRGCSSLFSTKLISNLPHIRVLDISDCISIRDMDCLYKCRELTDLECDHAPYDAMAILASTAILRKDTEYIYVNSNDWLYGITKSPKLEPFAYHLSRAFGLCAAESWTQEAFNKLINILINRMDLTPETFETALRESLLLGYPAIESVFETAAEFKQEERPDLLKSLLLVLTEIPTKASAWAKEFGTTLINSIEGNKHIEKEVAPEVCLFYTSMKMENEVKLWLEKITEPDEPVWTDMVNSTLAQWYLEKKEIRKAKEYVAEIKTPVEKDKALVNLAEVLAAENNPEEAGEALEQIVDSLKQINLAVELSDNADFTSNTKNIYRLFLSLQDDEVKLSGLIDTLMSQHPRSEFVKELVDVFGKGSSVAEGLLEAAEQFLDSSGVKENVKQKKLETFKVTLLTNPEMLKNALERGLVTMLLEQGLIDEEEKEIILNKGNGAE